MIAAAADMTPDAVDDASADVAVSGRRRALSRHRDSGREKSSRSGHRFPRSIAMLVSLGPALVVIGVMQWFSAAAQQVPSGAAGFAIAGSWAASSPGALTGDAHGLTLPPFGWLQLGLLDRGLLAVTSQSVLAAARDVQLVLTLVAATLVWTLARHLRASGFAAGIATALFGVLPFAVVTHVAPLPVNLAVVWLLAAAVLASGATRASAVFAGVCVGLAGVTEPIALLAAVGPALLFVWSARARRSAAGAASPWRRLAAAALAAVVVLGAAAGATRILSGLPATSATTDLQHIVAAAGTGMQSAGLGSTIATALLLPLGALIAAAALDAAVRAIRRRRIAQTHGRPTPSRSAGISGRRRIASIAGGTLLACTAAALAVAVASWVSGLPSVSRSADTQIERAAAWLRTSVPADQVVLVDLAAWPDLSRGSTAHFGWYAQDPATGGIVSDAAAWAGADYVVANARLSAHGSGAAAVTLRRSLAVATFGTGAVVQQIRAVPAIQVPAGPVRLTPAEQRSAAARRSAGRQLASNPRLVIGGADRALLTAGQVDSRVTLVLGQLLAQHHVTVAGFPAVSGDDSAVRRQVLVKALDGRTIPADVQQTGVVLRYLSGLRGTFAVARIDAQSAGVLATFSANTTFTPSS